MKYQVLPRIQVFLCVSAPLREAALNRLYRNCCFPQTLASLCDLCDSVVKKHRIDSNHSFNLDSGSSLSVVADGYAVTSLSGRNPEFCLPLDMCHVTHYIEAMIKTFADRYTRDLYETGKSRRFPPDIWNRAVRKLEYIDLATVLEDLKVPPGNKLHELERDRKGQLAISINDQYRICFRFEDGDAFDVQITDYH